MLEIKTSGVNACYGTCPAPKSSLQENENQNTVVHVILNKGKLTVLGQLSENRNLFLPHKCASVLSIF